MDEAADLQSLVSRGEAARVLLESPEFIKAAEDVLSYLQAACFASAPSATAERESFYHQHLGLQGVLGTLRVWVDLGQRAIETLTDTHEEA